MSQLEDKDIKLSIGDQKYLIVSTIAQKNYLHLKKLTIYPQNK